MTCYVRPIPSKDSSAQKRTTFRRRNRATTRSGECAILVHGRCRLSFCLWLLFLSCHREVTVDEMVTHSILYLVACLLLISHAAALSPSVASFTSCPSPRFDTFHDNIVGCWLTSGTGETVEVEAVMRSCGGAVQGIREMALSSEGVYLNRADDGFLFLDKGSYSWGPTQLTDSNQSFVTSFSIQQPNLRVLSPGSKSQPIILRRPTAQGISGLLEEGFPGLGAISWTKHERCRMPSAGLPWMVQRLRWETLLVDRDDNTEVPAGTDSTNVRTLRLREDTVTGADVLESKWNLEHHLWTKPNDHSRIHFAAVSCHGRLESVAREYDGNGKLVGLLFSNGVFQSPQL